MGPLRGTRNDNTETWKEDIKLLFLKLDELIDETNNMKAKLLMPTKAPINAIVERLKEKEDRKLTEKLERLINEGMITIKDTSVYC